MVACCIKLWKPHKNTERKSSLPRISTNWSTNYGHASLIFLWKWFWILYWPLSLLRFYSPSPHDAHTHLQKALSANRSTLVAINSQKINQKTCSSHLKTICYSPGSCWLIMLLLKQATPLGWCNSCQRVTASTVGRVCVHVDMLCVCIYVHLYVCVCRILGVDKW